MQISKIKNIKFNKGFTLTELVVVVAGLATLASFTIPNILSSIKLNRVEEAKALMNSYASDCLGKYRISTDPADFIENEVPDNLDSEKFATLGYTVEEGTCAHLAIAPIGTDKDLFAFDFRMSSEGQILKTATPSDNPDFLNSCKSWAGQNCGLSSAQKEEFARIAKIAKEKSECISNYTKWLNAGNSGENVSWDSSAEKCSRAVFAFEGVPVNSKEAIEQAQEAKYGKSCSEWRSRTSEASKTLSVQNGKPQTKSPDCGGVDYWYHSGTEFTSQVAWTSYDNNLKKQACIKNRSSALKSKEGKHTYGPTPGPDPCGKVVWICDGAEYGSPGAYETTKCGAPPKNPPPPAVPERCRNFKPHSYCRGRPQFANHPLCKCR